MLVFAAHVPHTPLLLPTVGKEHVEILKKTLNALKNLSEELYAVQPEIIFVIADHGNPFPQTFSINLPSSFKTNFSEFGDLTTKINYLPELGLTDNLQRHLRKMHLPFSMFSEPSLNYATAVPLVVLTSKLKKITILPFLTATNLTAKEHFSCGQILKEIINASNKRIAVISAGDLSHTLSSEAPAGLKPEGKIFDTAVREAIKTITASGLLQLEDTIITSSAECAYLPLLVLLGLLEGTGVRTEEICYETPLGVGYLTAHFHFL